MFLDIEYVKKIGIDYNALEYELVYEDYYFYSDRMVVASTGKLISGLVYEISESGHLMYYGYYKNGFEEGESVYFYENGNVESRSTMLHGRMHGEEYCYYENGKIKSIRHGEFGVILNAKEWDEDGNLIFEKKEPTPDDLKNLNEGRRMVLESKR